MTVRDPRQLVRDAGFDIEQTALETQKEGETDISYTWILARKASRVRSRQSGLQGRQHDAISSCGALPAG